LQHFYEFFTSYLGLDSSRFYASYFAGGEIKGTRFEPDYEARDIWLKIGIPEAHLIPFSEDLGMEAFVANTVEPVGGYRSELFYDLRPDRAPVNQAEFLAAEKDGQILEFFTHVLYNLEIKIDKTAQPEPNFSFNIMKREAIAAGFGPQRILRILENVKSIGEISILKPLLDLLGDAIHQFPTESLIVADHIRGLVFLAKDGVFDVHGQKNRSRRHIFRRYLQNFKKNFDLLPLSDPTATLKSLISESTDMFSILFPEFALERKDIQEKLLAAYSRFES
jgi:alanyl-tRNA synthetase